jgi:hypothetical protein
MGRGPPPQETHGPAGSIAVEILRRAKVKSWDSVDSDRLKKILF